MKMRTLWLGKLRIIAQGHCRITWRWSQLCSTCISSQKEAPSPLRSDPKLNALKCPVWRTDSGTSHWSGALKWCIHSLTPNCPGRPSSFPCCSQSNIARHQRCLFSLILSTWSSSFSSSHTLFSLSSLIPITEHYTSFSSLYPSHYYFHLRDAKGF